MARAAVKYARELEAKLSAAEAAAVRANDFSLREDKRGAVQVELNKVDPLLRDLQAHLDRAPPEWPGETDASIKIQERIASLRSLAVAAQARLQAPFRRRAEIAGVACYPENGDAHRHLQRILPVLRAMGGDFSRFELDDRSRPIESTDDLMARLLLRIENNAVSQAALEAVKGKRALQLACAMQAASAPL